MAFGLQVETWGPFALFSRPEMKTERVTYDVMTPSAARGLIESIYWHPGFVVKIDRIHVLNKIRYTNIRRNEVKSKVLESDVERMMRGGGVPSINPGKDIQQRAAMVLRDVHYVIDAHFELTEKAAPGDNEGKFKDIFRRRLEKGQCYSQPYFGTREFPAKFRPWVGGPVPTCGESRDLGYMLFDMDYSNPKDIQPMFFHAELENGILEVAGKKVLR